MAQAVRKRHGAGPALNLNLGRRLQEAAFILLGIAALIMRPKWPGASGILHSIVAGLLVVLVAGVAATSIMFNGLDTAAGTVSGWLGGLTIPAP